MSKLNPPSILGWLITGMILDPYALQLLNNSLLDAQWYQTVIRTLECAVGLMIGIDLVGKRIKKSGRSIITTLTQSLGTFFILSLVFSIVFWIANVPIYLAFIFGGIALKTAPALSIVREFRIDGPVTRTLIPMSAYMIVVIVLLPLFIGAITST